MTLHLVATQGSTQIRVRGWEGGFLKVWTHAIGNVGTRVKWTTENEKRNRATSAIIDSAESMSSFVAFGWLNHDVSWSGDVPFAPFVDRWSLFLSRPSPSIHLGFHSACQSQLILTNFARPKWSSASLLFVFRVLLHFHVHNAKPFLSSSSVALLLWPHPSKHFTAWHFGRLIAAGRNQLN